MFDKVLTLYAPTLQNGQTHSHNLSATPTNCLSVFGHFVGLALKGINTPLSRDQKQVQSSQKRFRTNPAYI